MRLNPSPRILTVLGEIEFENWQCISEFLDNSIDAMRKEYLGGEYSQLNPLEQPLRIDVTIPRGKPNPSEFVEISDNGPGMSRDALESSLRAGWTSNDPANNLGLFGMGFNVASARLGSITEVWTARLEDANWTKVTINLAEIGDDFEVPEDSIPKADPAEHGTRVRVTGLHSDRASAFRQKGPLLAERLGRIYSWILLQAPFQILINEVPLRPYQFCVWDASRSVRFGRTEEEISAVQRVDEHLKQAQFCDRCRSWESTNESKCSACGSTELTPKERRIWGWVGIQRYLDSSEYGIDFLRNGRRILVSDKSLFSFENDNGEQEIEYPVEQPANRGRIVGEIHLDHVPVDYRKDRFDTTSKEWKYAREVLRGRGPLKPERAKELGYERNESPIGQLFRGYRRNDPGRRSLIPGDGVSAIHEKAKAWGHQFHAGEADYQLDTIWWNAVEGHETRLEELAKPDDGMGGSADAIAVLQALGIGVETSAISSSRSKELAPQAPGKTVNQQLDDLLTNSTEIALFSRDIYVPILNEDFELEVREVTGGSLLDFARGSQEVPVLVQVKSGKKYLAFFNRASPFFKKFGLHPLHAVTLELAQALLVKTASHSKFSVTKVAEDINLNNFDDHAISPVTVQEQAESLLVEIRQLLVNNSEDFVADLLALVGEDDHDAIVRDLASEISRSTAPEGTLIVSRFPATELSRAVSEVPDAFFGGRVFRDIVSAFKTESAREEYIAGVARLVEAAALASQIVGKHYQVNELRIAQLQLDSLSNEMKR